MIINKILDICFLPFTLFCGFFMFLLRRYNFKRLPLNRNLLQKIGIWPIRNHYYEPLFTTESLRSEFKKARELPGLDFNESEQINLLKDLSFFAKETLLPIPHYSYHNENFISGDAEFLYTFIRQKKPKKVIEIGAGHSTYIIEGAASKNREEGHPLHHICVEPYEFLRMESLKLPLEIIRTKVEDIDIKIFKDLQAGDLLFIDSSHIIRPGGDVLHEYLRILPQLNPGVFVHIHDIFSPRDYLESWLCDEVKFWNEQYILEAFLSCNHRFKIIASLNLLSIKYPEELGKVCPVWWKEKENRAPGSFYIMSHGN